MTGSYALITPVKNEAPNLRRLAESVLAQTILPVAWVIVDDGSTDETPAVAAELAEQHRWIVVETLAGEGAAVPGAPVVRAFNAGLARLVTRPEVVVKLDADVSFDHNYFAAHLAAFAADSRLGIAGGACLEEEDGVWTRRHVTGDHVRGASRAYRRECLADVVPLVPRVGWDGIDELKAAVCGWQTAILPGLVFHHHRAVGARDGGRGVRWARQGKASYFMGYRFSYIVLRTLHHMRRNPAAAAMLWGYLRSALARDERYDDAVVRAYLRRQQSWRRIPGRAREALGRRAAA